MGEFIRDWATLHGRLQNLRDAGKTIVTTNGVFDVLHVGHVRYLNLARQTGDILVVCINSDESTSRLKGSSRPFVCEEERAELLCALSCVDFVTVFNESTPEAVLSVLKPDIHTKGGDYDIEAMPETETVRAHGGRVLTLPFVDGRSTTDLVARISEAARR